MIILHNENDEDSRRFVTDAIVAYGQAVKIIDWYILSDDEKAAYVAAGLSPSAFPSIIADADEKLIPRELPDGKPALDSDGKQIIDTVPSRLVVVRKPGTLAQAVADCVAIGRLAESEKVLSALNAVKIE